MWYLHSEKRYISFKGNVHLLFVRWKWVEIVKNLTFENAFSRISSKIQILKTLLIAIPNKGRL